MNVFNKNTRTRIWLCWFEDREGTCVKIIVQTAISRIIVISERIRNSKTFSAELIDIFILKLACENKQNAQTRGCKFYIMEGPSHAKTYICVKFSVLRCCRRNLFYIIRVIIVNANFTSGLSVRLNSHSNHSAAMPSASFAV